MSLKNIFIITYIWVNTLISLFAGVLLKPFSQINGLVSVCNAFKISEPANWQVLTPL